MKPYNNDELFKAVDDFLYVFSNEFESEPEGSVIKISTVSDILQPVRNAMIKQDKEMQTRGKTTSTDNTE